MDAVRGVGVRHSIETLTLVEPDLERAERLWRLLSNGLVQEVLAKKELLDTTSKEVSGRSEPAIEPRGEDPRLPAAVFLCYRREDTQDAAGRLHDRLVGAYGSERVFMDIDSVPLGIDFVAHVTEQISRCKAVVVMVGRQWLTVQDKRGRRRLDDPEDLVRVEVAAALTLKVPVIPVLVQKASMPDRDELPDDIRPLARRNGIQLRPERWREGVERLLKELNKVMGKG